MKMSRSSVIWFGVVQKRLVNSGLPAATIRLALAARDLAAAPASTPATSSRSLWMSCRNQQLPIPIVPGLAAARNADYDNRRDNL
jgi:hypothetical protein